MPERQGIHIHTCMGGWKPGAAGRNTFLAGFRKGQWMKRGQIRIVLAAISLLAGLLLSQSVALADLQITGNTDGSYFNATTTNVWDGLSFTPAAFDVTLVGGSASLTLGHFDLTGRRGCIDFYAGQDQFHLLVNFLAPVNAGGTTLTADVGGIVIGSAGFVALAFDKWAQDFTTSDGTFRLTLAPTEVLLGHDFVTVLAGGRIDLTARIENAGATPEASVIALLAMMILCLGACVRKFQLKQ